MFLTHPVTRESVGVVTGPYNVHVTDVQTSSVSLEWNDFKPDDYLFEYVLLYRQGTYDEDTSSWELMDVSYTVPFSFFVFLSFFWSFCFFFVCLFFVFMFLFFMNYVI